MSYFDDSPHEMHDNSLTPETADRLLDGEILSPEFAELAAMVSDVRSTVSTTPTPEVRGSLAEFMGGTGISVTTQPRRRSVFAEVIAFAGTVSGKVLIGGSLAAASVTGAQVTGLVELPLLTDEPATVVTTDLVTTDDAPAELPLETPAVEEAEPKPTEPEKADETEADEVKPDEVKADETEAEEAPKTEEAAEDDKADEDKADDSKVEDDKADESKEEDKPKVEDKPSNDEAIAALQAQLAADKEANYTLAADLIAPIKAEKKALLEALNAVLAPLEQARNDAKAPLYAELEVTEDPARKLEIEAELGAIWDQWIVDRDAAAAAANPAIADLDAQILAIEVSRDAEITRLLNEFQAAVDALG